MADKSNQTSSGGQFYTAHAAGASGAAAALAAPGRLCKVVVMSSGSAATDIYNNASAASGDKIFTVPATPTVGTVYDLQIPVDLGVYVAGATNTSALTVTTAKDTVYGR